MKSPAADRIVSAAGRQSEMMAAAVAGMTPTFDFAVTSGLDRIFTDVAGRLVDQANIDAADIDEVALYQIWRDELRAML